MIQLFPGSLATTCQFPWSYAMQHFVEQSQALCASVIKPSCPHVLLDRKLVRQIGAKEDSRGALRKEYLQEEEGSQRHVGIEVWREALKGIVDSMVYANTALETGRFCGCGWRRRERDGFAEVGELCLGVIKNWQTSSKILKGFELTDVAGGRDCPDGGGGGPPVVEDIADSVEGRQRHLQTAEEWVCRAEQMLRMSGDRNGRDVTEHSLKD